MTFPLLPALYTVLAYLLTAFYTLRAFSYCQTFLAVRSPLARPLSILCSFLSLSFALFLGLPDLLNFLVLYLMILAQFLAFFQGDLAVLAFCSSMFMFHLIDLQMVVSSVFILLFEVSSNGGFQSGALDRLALCLTLLAVLLFLEVFRRIVKPDALQLLLGNRPQLLFAATSTALINVYLLILSISYSRQAYSPLAATFLLCTGFLLFGAFYTSFNHALRMSALVRLELHSHQLETQLEQSYDEMTRLEHAAFTDSLTAIHNRRYGLDLLERYLAEGRPFCAAFLDIDHLKRVNDTYGHYEGDQYILSVVRTLLATLRSTDVLSRLGGDEFLLLLPDCGEGDAQRRLSAAAEAVRRLPFQYDPAFSYGLIQVGPEDAYTVEELLQAADQRMYAQKHPGLGQSRS